MSAPTLHRPSGLTWTVLRLHRGALYAWGAALLATTAVLTWMYVIGPDARAAIGPCGSPGTGLPVCEDLRAIDTDETYEIGIGLISTAVSYLMFPVAAWAGAALIGRELENGTAQLAWTQSVTPVRWLVAKLAVAARRVRQFDGEGKEIDRALVDVEPLEAEHARHFGASSRQLRRRRRRRRSPRQR